MASLRQWVGVGHPQTGRGIFFFESLGLCLLLGHQPVGGEQLNRDKTTAGSKRCWESVLVNCEFRKRKDLFCKLIFTSSSCFLFFLEKSYFTDLEPLNVAWIC